MWYVAERTVISQTRAVETAGKHLLECRTIVFGLHKAVRVVKLVKAGDEHATMYMFLGIPALTAERLIRSSDFPMPIESVGVNHAQEAQFVGNLLAPSAS